MTTFKKKEHRIVLSILFILATLITYVQYHKWVHSSAVRADTGFVFEMTDNLANGKGHVSSIHAAMNHFVGKGFSSMPAEEICQKELGKETEEFRNVFDSHTYYIAYIIAAASKIFDLNAIYYTTKVFGFFTLLYLVYRILRENNIDLAPSLLFTALIFVHPAFSLAMSGQIYIDRLFLPFAMLFLYFLHKQELNVWGLYIPAFFVCLISERAPLMLGIFTIGYLLLFWNTLEKERKIHLALIGTMLLSFALYTLNALSHSTGLYYTKSTFLPSSLEDLIGRFSNPSFTDNLIVFAIFSFVFLGVFSIFRWRLFLLAFVMLLPNIVGNIGGAEKTGYLTHYHTLYFPFLVFASTLGYIKMIDMIKTKKSYRTILRLIFVLVLLSAASSPYNRNISLKNITHENALTIDAGLYPEIFNENSPLRHYIADFDKMNEIIPDGSIVSSGELTQVVLWKNKINYFYPMGIDIADYAVLYATKTDNGFEYSAAVNYFTPEEAKKVDECIVQRMIKNGYDFEHQIIINNYAIIKRETNHAR